MGVVVAAFTPSGHVFGNAADGQSGGCPDCHSLEGLPVLVMPDDGASHSAEGSTSNRVIGPSRYGCGVSVDGLPSGGNIGVVTAPVVMLTIQRAEQPSRAGTNADALHGSSVAIVTDDAANHPTKKGAASRVAGEYLSFREEACVDEDQGEENVFHGAEGVT